MEEKVIMTVRKFNAYGARLRVSWMFAFVCICLSIGSVVNADFLSVNGTVITSIIRLIAKPEVYQGKRVQVIGYFVSGMEVRGLFLSKEDVATGNSQNAIWVEVGDQVAFEEKFGKFSRGYYKVVGTFDYRPDRGSGHLGAWAGELREISLFTRIR